MGFLGWIVFIGQIVWISFADATGAKPLARVFAYAELASMPNSQARGTIQFARSEENVLIKADIFNTPPGAHGIHIHDGNSCSPEEIQKGHWNPTQTIHGAPYEARSHFGDLGNILAVPDGTGTMKLLKLGSPPGGWDEIVGKIVVMHKNRDNLRSQPSGDSGPPIACGRIQNIKVGE